jgi:hypothetical protein
MLNIVTTGLCNVDKPIQHIYIYIYIYIYAYKIHGRTDVWSVRCVAAATGSCCNGDELSFSVLFIQQLRKSVCRQAVRLSNNTPRDSKILFEGTHNFRLVQNTVQGWTQLEGLKVCGSNTPKWHTSLRTAPVWSCWGEPSGIPGRDAVSSGLCCTDIAKERSAAICVGQGSRTTKLTPEHSHVNPEYDNFLFLSSYAEVQTRSITPEPEIACEISWHVKTRVGIQAYWHESRTQFVFPETDTLHLCRDEWLRGAKSLRPNTLPWHSS